VNDAAIVSQASRLPATATDESRRDGGDTVQSLQDAGDTERQTGKPAPRLSGRLPERAVEASDSSRSLGI